MLCPYATPPGVEVEGPVIHGQMRGVESIQVGFIQSITPTKWHANFDELAKIGEAGKGSRTRSKMQGTTYLDTMRTSVAPWNDSENDAIPGILKSVQLHLPEQPAPFVLKTGDTPRLPSAPGHIWSENGVNDLVDAFVMVFDFELSLAVRTLDESNGANDVYTKRAQAEWQFDGTGDVDENGVWELDGNGNGDMEVFNEVTNGDRPLTDGPAFNDALDALTANGTNLLNLFILENKPEN